VVLDHLALDPRGRECGDIEVKLPRDELAVLKREQGRHAEQYREGPQAGVEAGARWPCAAERPRAPRCCALVRRDGHPIHNQSYRDFDPIRDVHQGVARGGGLLPSCRGADTDKKKKKYDEGCARATTRAWTRSVTTSHPDHPRNGVAFVFSRPVLSKYRVEEPASGGTQRWTFASYPHFWELRQPPPSRRRSTECGDVKGWS